METAPVWDQAWALEAELEVLSARTLEPEMVAGPDLGLGLEVDLDLGLVQDSDLDLGPGQDSDPDLEPAWDQGLGRAKVQV